MRNKLLRGQLLQFGQLIDEAWQLKRQLSSKISSGHLDLIYENARKHGAIGGKLLGAGGGGFFLFFCENKFHGKVEKKLKNCSKINFKFENEGTQLSFIN